MSGGLAGLTDAEVAARMAAGQVNRTDQQTSRSVGQILRANVLTRFNAILGSLFVVAIVVGPLQDALFGVVLAVNTVIGIAQELRAKRTLDSLAVLAAPRARCTRGGRTSELSPAEVVLDDLLVLHPGDQVVADARVVEAEGLELDESLVSGEAEPVVKARGDEVLSGSVVVAGTGAARVVRVGADAYAQRLQEGARRFSLVRSELQRGTNEILRLVTWVMLPAAALLLASPIARTGQARDEAFRGSVAGVAAMVPEGLVLLTTIAFALGAVRLARRRVLVQELAALEGLARVDVLCIDKTGTLTEPGIALGGLELLGELPARDALAAMAASDPAPNATMLALSDLPPPADWHVARRVPFSSARKWSATEFEGRGTWVLGAPERLPVPSAPALERRVATHAAQGRRVLLVACTAAHLGDGPPPGLRPAALVVLEERVRSTAAGTVGYLLAQGVALKVLSGDAPATVSAVAASVGIPGAGEPVDATRLPEDPAALASAVAGASVFGRVAPDQKRAMVAALQARGHVVAMTGDGVNDIPALKAADLGLAMGSGSAATRAVARLVLLDSSFADVPTIVAEGRRVIANVERVANLFVTKTVYAAVLAVVVGAAAVPYPFYPRHLTIVSSLTIGIPGFFLAFAPRAPRATPGFVRKVLRLAVPAGLVAAAATFGADVAVRGPLHAAPAEARSTATLTLLGVGLAVLCLVARPLSPLRLALAGAMAVGGALLWVVPWARRVFGLVAPSAHDLEAMAVVLAASLAMLLAVGRVTGQVARGGTAGDGVPQGGAPKDQRPCGGSAASRSMAT